MSEHATDLRILQAMAGAPRGGAELFFERMVLALRRAGVHQHVLIRQDADRAARLKAGGLLPVELAFGGRFDFFTRRGFAREIARFQPQVVVTWMNRATHFCPPARPPGAFVHVGRLGGYYDLKYYQACDHLVCNTHDLVDYVVREGWPAARAHYLPNFVNEHAGKVIDRRSLATPGTVPVVFALGRLHENKGFDTLLQAVARAGEVTLWLAGDGPERQKLEELALKLGIKPRVRFLGWRDDVASLHAAADLFVCPSRHEPLGNVVLEAWAQGKPVIATASQGPSALIRDGQNGRLVPVDDHLALAGAIKQVLSHQGLRQTIAAGGRASFEAEYTEARVVEHWRQFFATITAQAVEAQTRPEPQEEEQTDPCAASPA